MKTLDGLRNDDRGIMVFAMLGIVIILVSIFAGAYFAGIRSERQRDIIDLAELKELERKIEKVERELENVAQEAGYLAIESVKENVERDHTIQDLKRRVGKRTTEIFERDFEERYSKTIQSGNLNLDFHLRPIKENQTDVEFVSLFLKEEGVDEENWSEIPGFFEIKRKVHANIENSRTDSFSTRKIEIQREVKTDFFILAERMRNFDPIEVRKMIDCMVSSYLNIKAYDLALKGEIGFKDSFVETFDTGWLEEYERGGFDTGEKRENIWEKNSDDFVEHYIRDEGRLSRNSLISEEEFIYISKLALMLEQIRAFGSYDEELLEEISEYFESEDKTVLNLIGEGRDNKVNLQGLVISLFQEKDLLSDEFFLPDLFLNRIIDDGILSVVRNNDEMVDSSFWMMNDLVKGKIDGQETWRFQEFPVNIERVSELDPEKSYLRVVFSLYSNAMNEALKSFKVNSEQVEEFVKEEIKNIGPLSWMDDVSIIGEKGTDQVIDSILHLAKNLSMSFGFDEGSYDKTASPFFYMYFLNNWGFDEEPSRGKISAEEIDHLGIHLGVQDKVKGELRSRTQSLENSAQDIYDEIIRSKNRYNETDWYEATHDQNKVWEKINKTLEPLQGLKKNRLFDENNSPYISQNLEKYHDELEESIEAVEENKLVLNQEAEEYTENILEMLEEFPGTKWRSETYEYLYFEGEGDTVQKNFLNHTDEFLTASAKQLSGSYNWSLEDYELAEHIDPGKRTDQSIGYRAIGEFTQEMIREFESPSPLDYSNPRNIFKLVNQNLFDLKGLREGERKSRFMNILSGEGDPLSDNLEQDDLNSASVDFTNEKVSSSNLDDVDGWWDEIIFEKSISSLENIRTELDTVSYELSDQNVRNEPYSDYADASFYRISALLLNTLIQNMEDYGRSSFFKSRSLGYSYRGEDGYFRAPVISAPKRDLTLHESRSLKHPGLSHSMELEVDMGYKGEELIGLKKISDTGTRNYRGDISRSQEWVNPFSSKYKDHYSTALFVDYYISEMEIEISSKGETKLVSERYSSSRFTGKFGKETCSSFTEIISPVPLLEDSYSPRSPSPPDIVKASLDRNVFNGSETKTELTLEIEEGEIWKDQDLVVEVLKKGDMLRYEPRSKRGVTNLHHISDEESGASEKTLLSKQIPSEEITNRVITIKFDLEGVEHPDSEIILEHMLVRIRPEIELTFMRHSKDLDQTTDSKNNLYSQVPSFSTSEQMYLFDEDEVSHLNVFRIGNDSEDEFPHNSFDLMKNIPSDSWVIRKDGFFYLVNFEENLPYREVLSGTYKGLDHDSNQKEILIDPKSRLSRDAYTSFPFIPENDYGYLVENEFLPLYMSSSIEEEKFFPDRMMPLTKNVDRSEWNSLHETLRSLGYTINLEKEGGAYLYYNLEDFKGPKRVDQSFERIRGSMKEFTKRGVSPNTDLFQGGEEILKETNRLENFIENVTSQRRSVFLAANFDLEYVKTAERLHIERENFTVGSLTRCLDLIGVNRTIALLEWLEEEREKSSEEELRAFLSFEDSFIKELPNRTGEENYSSALYSLDKKFVEMHFAEYRGVSINDISDIKSFEYLINNSEEEYVFEITRAGVTPTALKQLQVSYQLELEKLVDSIEKFSGSDPFLATLQELNSGEYEKAISLYIAGNFDESRVEWMPYGEDHPYLIIDDKAIYATIKPNNSNIKLEEFIDETLNEAVNELPPERGMVLMEVKSSDEFENERIESYLKSRVEYYDPFYQNISWVELKVEDGMKHNYLHL